MFKTAVLLLILMLAACSSSVRMSDEDRQAVQAININKKIILPDEMFYAPPTGAIIFGVIGAAISIEANRGPGQILASFARDNGVKIEEIVGRAFIRKMQDLPGIRLHQKQYDAQLNIKIEMYGLASKIGSMSEVKPILKVGAQLVTKYNKNGVLKWMAYSKQIGYEFQSYGRDIIKSVVEDNLAKEFPQRKFNF